MTCVWWMHFILPAIPSFLLYCSTIYDTSLNTRWFKYDRDWFVCKQAAVSPGHIWTTLYITNLKPSRNYMHHQFEHSQIPCSAHTMYLRVTKQTEQTAIISLYSINWLVHTTETECVYCAVRTGYLNMIRVNFGFYIVKISPISWLKRKPTWCHLFYSMLIQCSTCFGR